MSARQSAPSPALPTQPPAHVAQDDALLDAAVRKINETYVRKGLEVALEIGRYLLDTFFGGSSAAFREGAAEHVSFRALAARDDLQMHHIWLWRAVAVVGQLEALPPAAATQLPLTHHTLLLPLQDDASKRDLAEQALAGGWSKRRLEQEVRRARQDEPSDRRGGRKPIPPFVKSIRRLEKLNGEDSELWSSLDAITEIGDGDAERLLRAVTAMRRRCEEVARRLEGRGGSGNGGA